MSSGNRCLQRSLAGFSVARLISRGGVRTGLELADDVLRLRPELPVILDSGYSATLTGERLEELRIRELLVKPLDYRTLAVALARALPQRLGQTA